jgi:hypothetical protein
MTLRVILQIVPQGEEEEAYEIGRLDIFNKGPAYIQNSGSACEYGVIDLSPNRAGLYNNTVIHWRELGAWRLVQDVIDTLEIK